MILSKRLGKFKKWAQVPRFLWTKGNTMTVRILVLAGLIPLTLGGCASHTHNLIQDGRDQDITVGTFRHEGPEGRQWRDLAMLRRMAIRRFAFRSLPGR